ncbi:2,3-bisphosphoglycerate-independent phosphoglycerate mutase [Haematospirillum sp. H1815]|uniref:2,3-bisphosphoglycerate-independent phosphoglycerate mutase n=1 Tax=Haematospirillum sp. H1815 TaxID=2723108 RepID=UPI00143B9799|nr:2,3-bisphosphoglycerate-independent phosphoglycerate mutase [Haematospirillum sp. H1815]NKD77005.1 2,3-bisphosphoglycerate-independent phosphoglycerate mutase [Haematospirillum sp. H1815]
MTSPSRPGRPVVLCILDGWGYRPERDNNAIALAHTPVWDRMLAECPGSLLETSGLDVGLPDGQMGNSEVGHMNIGAGRIVMQDLPRIDACVADNGLGRIESFGRFVSKVRQGSGTVHLMGLLSPGGVHSHQDHMAALAATLGAEGLKVCLHIFTDGRDTPPRSARGFIEAFLTKTRDVPNLSLATLGGRYYAMDRDNRWDRVQLAYDAMVYAKGERAPNAVAAMDASYAAAVGDEFVRPCVLGNYAGMKDGDGILVANFRADRAREITRALLDPGFDGFSRGNGPAFSAALGMTEYSRAHTAFMDTLFPPDPLSDILGEVVSRAGLSQLRIAETEKYAHVTFFLNGGEETVYPGEDRILVPSPKVATYDLQPEMSAPEVTHHLEEAIRSGRYDLIVVNYANGDMVGHTGILEAAIKAAEAVDHGLGRLEQAIRDSGGTMIVTADHGNAELMKDPETGEPYTQHTVGKVHALLVNGPKAVTRLRDGRLSDLAPTVLALMGLPQPAAMTGRCLLDQEATNATRGSVAFG